MYRNQTIIAVAIASLLALVNNICEAGLITIINPSFESGSLADGQFTVPPTTISGWSYSTFPSRRIGTWNPPSSFYGGNAPDGQNVAYNEGGTISQALTAALIANTEYTLQVDVGRPTSLPQDYSVQLFAGASLLAEDANILALSPGNSGGTFQTSTVSFTSPATHAALGELLEIRINVLSNTDQSFDHVRLNAASVPEPSSFVLALFAGGCVLFRRGAHGKRKKQITNRCTRSRGPRRF